LSADGPALTTADGLSLATRCAPAAGAARGVLVLTHGFGEHSGRYVGLTQALTGAGVSVYAYDLRGHGRSDGPRGHAPGLAAYLDDLARVIAWARDQAPAAPLFLCGESAGGNIALNYALRRPAGLAGVIACGPWLRLAFTPPWWKTALARLVARVVPGFSLDSEIDASLLTHDAAQVQAYLDDPLNHERISAAAYLALSGSGEWALAHAADLLIPSLVLHGGDDQIISVEASEEFVAHVRHRDKRFRRYPGLYHEILNETNPQPVLDEITRWLGERC